MNKLSQLILCAPLLAAASTAQAHIDVTTPMSRYGGGANVQKEGPCGVANGKRSANVSTFAPGETITVTVDEYIPHPGWFRISFDQDGDDDFEPPVTIDPPSFYVNDAVLLDNLDPHQSGGGVHTFEVTLPNVQCTNCTLQILQIMLDKPPYDPNDSGAFTNDIYYSCIDLILEGPLADPDPAGTGGDAATTGGDVAATGGDIAATGGVVATGGVAATGGIVAGTGGMPVAMGTGGAVVATGGVPGAVVTGGDVVAATGGSAAPVVVDSSGCSLSETTPGSLAAAWLLPVAALFFARRRSQR